MSDWSLAHLFEGGDFLPHGICLTWKPELIWLHAGSDLLTALAYYSIPLALLVFAMRRKDLQFRWMFVLFGVFITACGTTHIMALVTLWQPVYLAEGVVKAITAVASVSTALALFPLIPRALTLPGPAQWEAMRQQLLEDVAFRRDAEAEARRLNAELEQRVAERTAELEKAYRELAESNRKLAGSQNLLQAIIDNSTAVIFVKDLEGRYLLVNRRYSELFHVDQHAIVGCSDYDLFPAALCDTLRAADRQALAAGTAVEFEETVPQDDGPHTYIAIKCPLFDAAGEAYAVCGIATDITERKQAMERLRQVVEAAPSAMLVVDSEGLISLVNAQAERLFGYEREELVGQTVDILVPESQRASHAHNRSGFSASAHTQVMGAGREIFGRGKNGDVFPIEIGLSRVATAKGEMVIVSITDITLRREAERERQARQVAEAANLAKSLFLANMSHELRTPLNSILGYAQILERDRTLGERQLASMNVIRQSGEQLLTLINDILDLAKIEAGKMECNPVDFQLVKFVHNIIDIISVKAALKDLELVCDLAPDLPQLVRADAKRLRQVLLNLLANAVKFTDRGSVTLRVRLAAPARLRFEVQDTGAGIPADQLDLIFQPFEQAGEAHRRIGGTGLGLTISRQYVQLMGGDIQVQSRPGQGSTFAFELEVEVMAFEAAPADDKMIVTGYFGPRKKILVVDDVASNRSMVTDLLAPLGFEVSEAADGRECLEAARRLQPDLILMDIVMPGMDGLDATRRLRRLPGFEKVPIIALSAGASADSEKIRTAGTNGFLSKPIDADVLLDQIAMLLRLEWIYNMLETASAPESDTDRMIVLPPRAEMEILHRLARLGNMQTILERTDYLAELDERYRPFAKQLVPLAKGYQSKAILRLVERYLNSRIRQ